MNTVKIGTNTVDTVRANGFSDYPRRIDAEIYLANAQDDIYLSSTFSRDVSALLPEGDFYSGQEICNRGQASGIQRCNNLGRVNAVFNSPDGIYEQFTCWSNAPTLGGDSGAPYYLILGDNTASAAGIHTGIVPWGDIGDRSCFTSMEDVLGRFNASLLK